MMGSAICVNCSIISSDWLFLMKQTERGPRLLFLFSQTLLAHLSDSTTGFDRTKRHINGESGRLKHDDYHFHLSWIVIISVGTGLAFRLGIINGPHVAGAYLVYPRV